MADGDSGGGTAARGRLEVVGLTDTGVVRSFNEDSIAMDQDLGLLLIADGMGGYKAGDVASRLAASLIQGELARALPTLPRETGPINGSSPHAAALKGAIERANRAICRTAQSSNQYHGMGTTVAAALLRDGRITIAHVGDSRVYRWRGGRLELLTHDHSLLQEQVELGLITSEDAKLSHNRNLVTRALGVGQEVLVDIRQEELMPEDIYLLCSDGLNDMVDDADIELAVSELRTNLPLAARILLQMANDNGGHDNISVILGRVGGQAVRSRRISDRLFGWLRFF